MLESSVNQWIKPLYILRVDDNPQPWQRTRGQGKRRFHSELYRNYQEAVGLYARAAMVEQGLGNPLAGDLGVILYFYRENNINVDIDNLIKAVFDSIQKIAFNDDNQVRGVVATLHKGFKTRCGFNLVIYTYDDFEALIDPLGLETGVF